MPFHKRMKPSSGWLYLKTQARSLAFGRRLYLFQPDELTSKDIEPDTVLNASTAPVFGEACSQASASNSCKSMYWIKAQRLKQPVSIVEENCIETPLHVQLCQYTEQSIAALEWPERECSSTNISINKKPLNPAAETIQLQLDSQVLQWMSEESLLSHTQNSVQAACASSGAMQAFLHELAFYRMLHIKLPDILLPFDIISTKPLPNDQLLFAQGLMLPHAASIFDIDPHVLTKSEVLQLCFHAADVLDRLASIGWLHGDIKKAHFVSWEGTVRLLDFEQAVPISRQDGLEQMNATPRYMAPELFHGQAKSLQSEVYALGIVLLEWLTGSRLQAKNYQDWAYLHCQRLIIELPAHFLYLKPILQGMLAKQKSQRLRDFYQIKMRLMTEIA